MIFKILLTILAVAVFGIVFGTAIDDGRDNWIKNVIGGSFIVIILDLLAIAITWIWS